MVLVWLSLLGGITVFFGGYLIYRDHVTSGKLLIGLGAGVGIPWLLIILLNVVLTRDLTSVITRYSITGWAGITLAFMARTIAK
jgi:hypothetical protein